jgi:hypothetical protein
MMYFPDEPAKDKWARYAVAVLPLLYLIVALLYSANSAPWGRQVDPESAYAMNGLAWAAGYPMMKNDHPGTTTILLIGILIKLWTFLAGRSDVIEFGLKNYDAIIYAARAAEAAILSGVLLVSGVIVRNATRSWLAAMLFQVAPFVSSPIRADKRPPTKADFNDSGWRPYLCYITCENLIGWKTTVIKGVPTLTQIRIFEQVSEPFGDYAETVVDQIRVVERDRWQTWRRASKTSDGWVIHQEGTNGLGKITLAPVYLNRSGFMTGEPPLQDLADLNVAHWQSQSDQRNILTIARVPILFGSGIQEETVLEIGASSMVRVSDPNATLQLVEHTGAAIGAGDKDLLNLQYQMQACGLQLLVENPGQTATGEMRDDVKENSALAHMVAALQDALELSFGFMAEYIGLGKDAGGSLSVNTDWGVTGRMSDIQWLTSAVISRKIDDQTYIEELKRRSALGDAVDVETVLHRIDTAGLAGGPTMDLHDDHTH